MKCFRMSRTLLFIIILNPIVGKEECSNESSKKIEKTSKKVENFDPIFEELKLLRDECGPVCDTSIKPTRKGKYYDVIEKQIDCRRLFENNRMEKSAVDDSNLRTYSPPNLKDLSKEVKSLFSQNGKVLMMDFYLRDISGHASPPVWTVDLLDGYRKLMRRGTPYSGYGQPAAENVQRYLLDHLDILGGHALVIGTEQPWIEAQLLEYGIENITVLDYVPIISQHPQIRTITPAQMNQMFLNGDLGPEGLQFDLVVTYSSLEHSGLGRYGDSLNPWADLITMAKAWCVTKPRGRALIGVPTGFDAIYFNAHRLYGPLQYSHLFANWEVVYTEAKMFKDGPNTKVKDKPCLTSFCYEPIHILEKSGNLESTL